VIEGRVDDWECRVVAVGGELTVAEVERRMEFHESYPHSTGKAGKLNMNPPGAQTRTGTRTRGNVNADSLGRYSNK